MLAANVIASTFNKNDIVKLPKPEMHISEIEVVKARISEEMRLLGLANFTEYIEYLNMLSSDFMSEQGKKANKSGIEL